MALVIEVVGRFPRLCLPCYISDGELSQNSFVSYFLSYFRPRNFLLD